jgi:ATP-binding cassette subfamily F protein 3
MLQLQNLTLRAGAKNLFSDCSLALYAGMKIGVVGRNGCGKTTLFNAIQGTFEPYAGMIKLQNKLTIGVIEQETKGLDISALEYVMQGDQKWHQVQQELQQAEIRQDHDAIMRLHMLLADLDGYTINARASKILAGLGVKPEVQNDAVKNFSGGWRMRLNIARCLLERSDLLLLDEPTNHLDLSTIVWLEKWLLNYKGCLLVISHDREFLDTIASFIIHIDKQQVKLYKGNYSAFEEQVQAMLNFQEAAYKKQQEKIQHMMNFVNRFKAKATKAKQAQSRLKAIEKLEKIAKVQVDLPFTFEFFEPIKQPTPMIKLYRVNAGYDNNQVILKRINLNIEPGIRIGLIGKNGEGKSTLIKTLAGMLPPISGEVTIYDGVKFGYFDQHNIDHIDLESTPLKLLANLGQTTTENNLRSFLASFAFDADMIKTPIKKLSGGEKSRLALALIIWQKPNLLLLDEPTNHLDLQMRSALTIALQSFTGAMVLVSHDRHLLKTTVDKLYLIDNHTVTEYTGDVNDYLAAF